MFTAGLWLGLLTPVKYQQCLEENNWNSSNFAIIFASSTESIKTPFSCYQPDSSEANCNSGCKQTITDCCMQENTERLRQAIADDCMQAIADECVQAIADDCVQANT